MNEKDRISRILSKNEPMLPLTVSQRKQHDEATIRSRRFVLHVVIQHLKGYDSHLILKHFDKELRNVKRLM